MNQKEPVETNWHIEREVYSQPFESIEEFVQVNIIDMKEVHCVKIIRTLHQSQIREWVATNLRMQAYLLRIWKTNY